MQTQMHVPSLTKINKSLMVVSGVMFILGAVVSKFAGVALSAYLGISASKFFAGHLYQIITYPFIQKGLLEFLFNCMVIWFIGSDLESRWGRKTYLKFLLSAVIGAGFFYTLVVAIFYQDSFVMHFPLIGLSGVSYALLLAYAIIFSDRILTFMLIFPMKAKYFCLILIGIELYMGIFSQYSQSAWGHLAAMASGFIFLKYTSMKARGFSIASWKEKKRREKMKKKLTLVKDRPDEKDPRYWQ